MERIIDRLNNEGLRLSSISKRMMAYFIDEVIISFLVAVAFYGGLNDNATKDDIYILLNNLVWQVLVLKVVYQAFFVWLYGATLGKIFVKIKIINIDDFDKPNALYSIVRAIVRIFSESIFYFGFIWALFHPLRQTWHDLSSRSLVVDAQ